MNIWFVAMVIALSLKKKLNLLPVYLLVSVALHSYVIFSEECSAATEREEFSLISDIFNYRAQLGHNLFLAGQCSLFHQPPFVYIVVLLKIRIGERRTLCVHSEYTKVCSECKPK